MQDAGYDLIHDHTHAGIIIINTCAFIQSATEESLDTIFDYAQENPQAYLIVAGCLPLRYRIDLKDILTEVNMFLTPEQIPQIPAILADGLGALNFRNIDTSGGTRRVITTPGYSYLRISDGCNRKCRYCSIPHIRGKLVSADQAELISEAEFLVKQGIRELILVGQDLTSYGKDRKANNALLDLLAELEKIDELRWIRLMYLHPHGLPRRLPEVINSSKKILPYLDVPLQHVTPDVLKSMGRPPIKGGALKFVESLRKQIPGVVLRTTLMVGFPTETDDDYRQMREFVEEALLERLGIFTYSLEEGTDAFRLGDPISPEIKDERAAELMEIQADHERERNSSKIGAIEECIIESYAEETPLLLQGRLWDQAPEVDGSLFVTLGDAISGEIRRVKITEAHEYDLFGELIDEEEDCDKLT